MAGWTLKTMRILSLSFLTTVLANQIQFYDQSTTFGVAISSAILQNGTELQMQITAPSSYGWAALGSGNVMDESIMFIIYPSSQPKEVTLSIRSTKQHDEPRPVKPDTVHAKLIDSSVEDGRMSATILWQEPSQVLCNVVDPRNHLQPWIWAVGPNQSLSTDKADVTLKEHSNYGVVFADMPQSQTPAQSINAPKISGTSNVNVKPQPKIYRMLVYGHALVLGGAFVLVFPFGVIGLRFNWKNKGVKFHMFLQIIAAVAAWLALGVAITMSIIGIQYAHFSQPHQLVGIGVAALLTVQIWLGWAHHARFKLLKRRTWFSFAHMGLGRVVIYGGMVNAVLGLLLSSQRPVAMVAGGLCGVVAIIVEFVAIRAHIRRRRDMGTSERIKGYNSSYLKLKDVSGGEQELHGDEPIVQDWERRQNFPQSTARYEEFRHAR